MNPPILTASEPGTHLPQPPEAGESTPRPEPTVQRREPPHESSAHEPRRQQPQKAVVSWAIIGLNVLAWLIPTVQGYLVSGVNPYWLLDLGAKVNPLIVQGQVWRLVTPIFLHVGLIHLAFNTYAIYVIGPPLERSFGAARFVSIYLLSGVYGVLFSFLFSPHASAGASGAIFGLIGTQAVFLYRYRDAFGQRGRRQFYNTLSVITFNLILTFAASNIDIWGHIGGLVSGAAIGWGLMPHYAWMPSAAGPVLIDRNRSSEWRKVVLGAVALLAASTWIVVTWQAGRL